MFVSEKKVKGSNTDRREEEEEEEEDIFSLKEKERKDIDVVVVYQTRTKKSVGAVALDAKRFLVFFFFVRVVFNEKRATTTFQGRAKTGTTR